MKIPWDAECVCRKFMAGVKCYFPTVIPAKAGIFGFDFCINVAFYYSSAGRVQILACAGMT